MPRKRILFIAEAVTLAHVARPMVLAQGLSPDTHEVEFACHPRFLDLFPQVDFPLHVIDSIPSDRFIQALAKGAPLYDLETLEHYVEAELALFADRKPDIVIGDFRLSLAVSTALSSIPYLNITNAYWSPYAEQRFPVPELPLVKVLGVGLAQRVFDLVRPAAFAYHCLPMHRLRRRHGLPSLGFDLRRVYTHADHVLYADLPDWVPMREPPSNHHFLGPLCWSPATSPPPWWDDIPKDLPLIYITLGSSGRADLLPLLIRALEPLPVGIMAATAGRIEITTGRERVYQADYLPGEAASARARLVICNGGSPTVHQALAAGVPVLGLPTNLDQYLNMQAVVRHGAGLCLRADRANGPTVKQAVARLLEEPGFHQHAHTLGERISTFDPVARLSRILSAVP